MTCKTAIASSSHEYQPGKIQQKANNLKCQGWVATGDEEQKGAQEDTVT